MQEYHYYCCEKCGKRYNKKEDAQACENGHNEKATAEKRIQDEINEFYKKFGEYPFVRIPYSIFRF